MSTVVTRKGQVTIPKKVREHLGIVAGTAVDFDLAEDGRVTVRRAGRKGRSKRSPFARVRGRASTAMSTDAIMALTRGDA
jgi:AbrB family looped-hinge helix DNA binding protein